MDQGNVSVKVRGLKNSQDIEQFYFTAQGRGDCRIIVKFITLLTMTYISLYRYKT